MFKLLYFLFFIDLCEFSFSVIVEYKWSSTAPEYHIVISSNSNFYFPVLDDLISTDDYVADLEPGHYYIRIAPVLKGVEGLFSDPVDFTVSRGMHGEKGSLSEVNPSNLYENEEPSPSNILAWNCTIKNNSPLNLDSTLYYSLDSPIDFIKVKGLMIRIDTRVLKEGRHTLFYKIVNPLGVESKISSLEFLVDRSSPFLDIEPDNYREIGDKIYLFPGSRINFSCQYGWGSNGSYFGVNGRKIEGPFYTVTRDTNILKVICFAMNEMNYESRLVRTFYVKTVPPLIILYLNQKEVTSETRETGDNTINIKITDYAGILQFFTILDGITNKNMTMPINYLKYGLHKFKIIADDIFENRSEKSYMINVIENNSRPEWIVYPSKD